MILLAKGQSADFQTPEPLRPTPNRCREATPFDTCCLTARIGGTATFTTRLVTRTEVVASELQAKPVVWVSAGWVGEFIYNMGDVSLTVRSCNML